ncbi:MAG: tryptophan synthase subunit beta [Candidatus Obscuribacterales bacterium]|jgi:tryptophan synthase beta chain|nr:tryptophan synthase subunit beta [Candidatus Obscuribacterales bacterium]
MLKTGYYGEFGGVYAPETLMPALEELEAGFLKFKSDLALRSELNETLQKYAGRPTPIYLAENLSRNWGARIILKREDLLHGGAHKTNNAIGQGLLAKSLGKTRLIAETGAGQHGVATAMIGALLGMQTEIYMGEVDIERQHANVLRMKLLGATVHAVKTGGRTLKDAINAAMRDWIATVKETHYLIGTAAGPHPFPEIVKYFQSVIGSESREQMLEDYNTLPDYVIACVGGGSNAIGMFSGFIDDQSVRLIGVEPAGKGVNTNEHGAVLAKGTNGCLHGMMSKVLQDEDGQIHETYSIAAGLDYPSVGPEHAFLQSSARADYTSISDDEAIDAYHEVSRSEGIIPALESSHALAYAKKLAGQQGGKTILVNVSGRGDKDLEQVMNYVK